MKISKKDPVLGLKKVISRLFDVKFDRSQYKTYHPDLPKGLKKMYEIDRFFSKDCRYETIHFFCNQDRLVKYDKLTLVEKDFVFVHENQNNWKCRAQLKSQKVYFEDCVEPQKSRFISDNIDVFLTTFGLQEIGFNLPYYFGLNSGEIADIKTHFKKVEFLWEDNNYIHQFPFENDEKEGKPLSYSYYLVDDDCLVMYAGMYVFGTKNLEKFEHYKGVLPHYEF
jgi:hypothetical protein